MYDITIVGGGCCGLACAAAAAAQGWRINVLERRADPDSTEGSAAMREADSLLKQANATRAKGGEPSELLARCNKIRQVYWATQARNVILDSHSVSYLDSLGVATSQLPRISHFELNGPPDGPKFGAELLHRQLAPETDALNPVRMLWQRDWTVLAPLGHIERLLRARCDQLDNVDVAFDVTVEELTRQTRHVAVRVSA